MDRWTVDMGWDGMVWVEQAEIYIIRIACDMVCLSGMGSYYFLLNVVR